MKELQSREDVELMIDTFYSKVVKDDTINFFFSDIAKINWEKHLPRMYAFWESILFGKMTYKGNPMTVHFAINHIKPMEKQHFDRWLKLWRESIEENFVGENASLAITKSENIGRIMSYKMEIATRLKD